MTDAGQLWGALPAGLAALAFGYLAGSIPFGLIITRLAGMEDIRAIGSGNIGATNVLRTGRKELAAATLALRCAQGHARGAGNALLRRLGACDARRLRRLPRPPVSGVAQVPGRQGRRHLHRPAARLAWPVVLGFGAVWLAVA